MLFWNLSEISAELKFMYFFILTNFITYTFFLENIYPSRMFVIQNILISNDFHRENAGLLREIEDVCCPGTSWRYRQNWNVCIINHYYLGFI